MATKKDLVEAYSFSRRRLVTAFVSGAPGGREVEPARPGRMIVGGVALAVLLIAGAAVAGALTGNGNPDFDKPGLVTNDRGALYIILLDDDDEPLLRPIINVTSAQLILGNDIEVQKVDDDDLAEQEDGSAIGILDAPAVVPPASGLVNSNWTSCTKNGAGLRTEIVLNPDVERRPDVGFFVETKAGKEYLIAEASHPEHPTRAYRYALPANSQELLDKLSLVPTSGSDPIRVSDEWLELFPAGGSLDGEGLGIPNFGEPAGLSVYPADTRVGDIDVSGTNPYVITKEGRVPVSGFAEKVLRATSLAKGRAPEDRKVREGSDPPAILGAVPWDDSYWPDESPTEAVDNTDEICSVLETAEGQQPAARLATVPLGSTMLDDVEAADRDVQVEAGAGALVRSGGWLKSSGGTAYLVDDSGRSYSLAGDLEIANLGYGGVDEVVVPEAWLLLFQKGPDLSRLAALCPPRSLSPNQKAATGDSC